MYEENIRRGMALLDEKGPDDWRSKIDTSRLDMNSFRLCILGQLYGDYLAGVSTLGLSRSWSDWEVSPEYHGFVVECCSHPESCGAAVEQFTNEWLSLLGTTAA